MAMACIGKAGWACHIASVGKIYVGKQCHCLVVAAKPAAMRAVAPDLKGIVNARPMALVLMEFAVELRARPVKILKEAVLIALLFYINFIAVLTDAGV